MKNSSPKYLDSKIPTVKVSDKEIRQLDKTKASGICTSQTRKEILKLLNIQE